VTALAGFRAAGTAAGPLAACERMLKAQQIYAPDDAPVCRAADGIAVGRRLFRLLPEDVFDRGPVAGHGGRSLLVADARIDNRADLCAALGIGAEEARRLPDSAIIMRVLERWGEEGVDRLHGDFAFAWWDGAAGRLVLARDFLGQRPLHYHRGAGFFAFASMPKGLHALPEVPTAPDEEVMARFLALMPEDGTGSFFRGIERVPAAHLCIVTGEGLSLSRYWNPAPRPLRLRRDEDHAEAVREALDRAVAARLRGTGGRVATHLSGGLDSSAVTATAARLLAPEGRVTAFTAVPREGYDGRIARGRFADEGPHAATVAALYPNVDHVLIRTGTRSPFAALDRNFFLFDRPMLNLCNAVWADAIADGARERRLSVMLTGQMGNMSFSYTGLELLPELLAAGKWLRLARLAVQLRRHGTRLESVAAHAIGPFLPARWWTAINRLRGRYLKMGDYCAIDPARAGRLRAEARAAGLDLSYRPRRDPVGTRLWVMGRTDLGGYNKGHLGGWGIDMRDPTADRALIELCLSIPAEAYLAGGRARALARDAFADRLPPLVLDETRKGYQAADWHEGLTAARGELRNELDRIAALPEAEALIDTDRLRLMTETWPERDWNLSETQYGYRLALLRGVSCGHFLRRASGSNL
jgi:asparagine synthase (glutamine-hydrolysing)